MVSQEDVRFGAFRIARAEQRLYRGDQPIDLRPKVWDLLLLLSARPDELLSLADITAALWPDTVVEPHALTRLISDLRRALGDDGVRHVENVPRRGYRFRPGPRPTRVASDATAPASSVPRAPVPVDLVSRDAERAALSAAWRDALGGRRQVVFLSGEAGIGKTSLIEQTVRDLAGHADGDAGRGSRSGVLVARGRCVALHGDPAPYGVFIEALQRIAHLPHVLAALRRTAPAWLLQMPGAIAAGESGALAAAIAGSGSQRMLNEAALLCEAIAAASPLLLVLEDAHWADAASIDLLSTLVARDVPARLMIVLSYRAAEVALGRHPLHAVVQRACRDDGGRRITLGALPPVAIETLYRRRLDAAPPEALVPHLERMTGGNPLFLRLMLDHLVEQGWVDGASGRWIAASSPDASDLDVPQTLREMIEVDVLHAAGARVGCLEAAALVGDRFTPAAVAAATQQDAESVDDLCHELARHGRIVRASDGAPATEYAFVHALYRQVLGERVSPTRARALHQRIGEHLEQQTDPPCEATRLAHHFTIAGDLERAALHLERSAVEAMQRLAHREASTVLERAIAAIAALPDSAERRQREAARLLDLGNLRISDMSSSAARPSYERALVLSRGSALGSGDALLAFRAQLGRCLAAIMSRQDDALALAESLVSSAAGSPQLAAAAHQYALLACLVHGDLDLALAHGETAVRMLPQALPDVPRAMSLRVHVSLSRVLLLLGRAEESLAHHQRALDAAAHDGTPFNIAEVLVGRAFSLLLADDPDGVRDAARRTLDVIPTHESPGVVDLAVACCAWAEARTSRSDLGPLQRAIDATGRTGETWLQEFLRLRLAEQHRRRGDQVAARRELSQRWDLRGYAEPERWRVLGLVKLDESAARDEHSRAGHSRDGRLRSDASQAAVPWDDALRAEDCLARAIEIARRQHAALFARRAEHDLETCRASAAASVAPRDGATGSGSAPSA